MATHRESRAIARPAEEIFDIVADVERYPEFVPLIREARVFNRVEDRYETEQSLALGLLTHRFRTRTELVRPHGITVVCDDQAFCRFDIRWQFAPLGEDRCHVDFTLDCEPVSFFLIPVIQLLVLPMATSMVDAFEARVHALAVATERPESRDEP